VVQLDQVVAILHLLELLVGQEVHSLKTMTLFVMLAVEQLIQPHLLSMTVPPAQHGMDQMRVPVITGQQVETTQHVTRVILDTLGPMTDQTVGREVVS
jgi:hypothetical protein